MREDWYGLFGVWSVVEGEFLRLLNSVIDQLVSDCSWT